MQESKNKQKAASFVPFVHTHSKSSQSLVKKGDLATPSLCNPLKVWAAEKWGGYYHSSNLLVTFGVPEMPIGPKYLIPSRLPIGKQPYERQNTKPFIALLIGSGYIKPYDELGK